MGAFAGRFIWLFAAISVQNHPVSAAQDGINTNPEPVINAVLAALEAQKSAFLTNWLLVALLIGALLIVGGLLVVLSRIQIVKEQTDGMHVELMEATRKLALIEGEVKGRASQKTEDAVSGKGE